MNGNPAAPEDLPRPSLFSGLWLLAAAALLPVLGLVAWNLHDRLEHRLAEVEAVALRLASFTAADTARLLAVAETLLEAAARQPGAAAGRDCDRAFAALAALGPAYGGYAVADAAGRVLCSGGLAGGGRLPEGAHLELPPQAARGGFWIGAARPDAAGWTVPLLRPLDAAGFAGVRLRAAELRLLVAVRLPEGAAAGILDGAGRLLAGDGDDIVFAARSGLGAARTALGEGGAGGAGGWRGRGEDGAEYQYGFARVAGSDWTAVAVLPVAAQHAAAWADALRAVLAALAALALAAVLVFCSGRRLLRRAAAVAESAHAALAAGEARLRDLFALAADWWWEDDAGHRFTRVGGAAYATAPVDKNVIGKRRWELPGYAPAAEGWDDFRARLARREAFYDLVFAQTPPSGATRYLRVSGVPAVDAAGAFAGYRGVAADITAEWTQRLALAASERRYRDLFEKQHLIALLVDPADGRIAEANAEAAACFGQSPLLLAQQRLGELGLRPRQDGPAVADWLRDGAPTAAAFTWTAADGRRRVLEAQAGPAGTAERRLVLLVFFDITARSDAETALRRLSVAVEQSPTSIIITDPAGNIEWVNPYFEQVTGWPRQEVLGRNPRILQSGLTPRAVYAELWRTLLAGGVWRGELCNRSRAGELYWEQAAITAVRDEAGRVSGYIAVKENITELKRREAQIADLNATLERRVTERTEELARANRELDAFSYSVSHDLRTPLRAIHGFSHMLEEADGAALSAEGRALLGRVKHNAVRMGELIDDMLQFARIGRAELALKKVSPAETAREIVREQREQYPQAEATVDDLPEALCDPAMLRQVFANLIGNAFKYSARAAAPRIEVGARYDAGETVYFVRDNGAGFDMRHAKRLFGVFQRLHHERDFPGTGVGLAVAKRIVERHGGRIWAESAPDEGATFSFTLGAGVQ